MFTKVHTKVLEVECKLPDAVYNGYTTQANGMFQLTTFTPVITGYQYVGGSAYSVGSGKSLLDMSTVYQAASPYSGILNSLTVNSVWCDCTVTSDADAVITSLHYYWSGSNSNAKKVRYIDVYRIENGNYTLHETLETSNPSLSSAQDQLLVLKTPIQFKGTIALRIVARNRWGDYYMWVTEIYLKGFIIT